MPSRERRRPLRGAGANSGAGPGSPIAGDFFQPAHLKKTNKVRRMGHAVKNWLHGLPVHQQEDVLAGIESEHNLVGTVAGPEAAPSPAVDGGPLDPNVAPAGAPASTIVRKMTLRERWKAKRARRKLQSLGASGSNGSLGANTPNNTELAEVNNSSEDLKKDFTEDQRPPIRIIQVPPPASSQPPTPNDVFGYRKGDELCPYGTSNQIRTAKYSLLTFLPKNLFEQFRRVANIYFLFIVILQAIPAISNYNVGLAALPLLVILGITATKDGVEDWARHQQDMQVNYSLARCLHHPDLTPANSSDEQDKKTLWSRFMHFWKRVGQKVFNIAPKPRNPPQDEAPKSVDWIPKFWKDVRVGDLVLLSNNEMIPADILILATSEPDATCYVETKNLDGETNLKIKRGTVETNWVQSAEDAARFQAEIQVEAPSSNLFSFIGRIILPSVRQENQQGCSTSRSEKPLGDSIESFEELSLPSMVPVDSNGLLLRGCVLRNTAYIIGLVVYTGPHTKLILNSGGTPSKRSRIERQMNPQIILNFLLLFIICVSCAIVQGILAAGEMSRAPFWVSSFSEDGSYSSALAGFLTFWSSVILFQTLVPISLYLTVELCKTAQAFLIHSDIEMYHKEGESPCVPRAWNLSDDLGQIEYLFSDKTGTLTRNVMEFRRISVNGRTYGFLEASSNIGASGARETPYVDIGSLLKMESEMTQSLSEMLPYSYVPPSKSAFIDPQLLVDIQIGDAHSQCLIDFFTLLTLCHTVLIERLDPDIKAVEAPHTLVYKAQSPDEAALLATSRDLGFVFLGREQERVNINILGHQEQVAILHILEFNSTRKRMSVIVRRADGRIQLLCKGADNIIYERLAEGEAGSLLGRVTLEHLEAFGEDGLRTLCLAYRDMTQTEYSMWADRLSQAMAVVHEREVLVDGVADELERGFRLLGATAIEDRLQEGVPECIERLQQAGIKIWVLTGDKLETAINIGFSCRLLRKDMTLLIVRSTDVESTREQLRSAWEKIWSRFFDFGDPTEEGPGDGGFALIIEGGSLKHAFDQKCRKLFLALSSRCTAVICCRVSPLQKAKVVELLKRGKNAMTLAIGDGANDVSMLQAADIGVGISGGQEGMQAVMSSDYAIGQFRFLQRLLLVHGRWSYLRTAEVTLLSFYKNILFVVLLFWYQFYCGFTAQYVYDYMYLLLFNLLFSVAPLLALGILDRDLDGPLLGKLPPVYSQGIEQQSYSLKLFGLYVLEALYQSLVCFFVPTAAYADIGLVDSGYTESKALLGNVMAMTVITACNLYMVINTFSWTIWTFVAIPVAMIIPVICLIIYSLFPSQELFGTWRIFLQPLFYGTALITLVMALAPRCLIKFTQSQLKPGDLDICREVAKWGGSSGEDALIGSVGEAYGRTDEANAHDARGGAMTVVEVLQAPQKALLGDMDRAEIRLPMTEAPPPPQPATDDRRLRNSPSMTTLMRRHRLVPLGTRLASPRLRVFNLRTGRFERINGFAFSQSEGMQALIEGRAMPAFGSAANGAPNSIRRPPNAATSSLDI